ncbi:pantoate--beta-alanine ligase [Gramella sp. AN32]|uniref:Pantothenate synthetase n=1 Tax=Christiangramia antarctica TaxID=2058158 RepID=A0ABW5X129_9FLAO|nr:pantoate--beta-alanine ligase [Gramella sp. AN32]
MQVFKEKRPLIDRIEKAKSDDLILGLVPTMGALHEGHISLIQTALQQSDQVVVTIFVNPTQFDNPEDLDKYPRTLENDLLLISALKKDIWVFTPSPQELYGENIFSEHFEFQGLEKVMEGKFRSGHFDGVGTVVKRIFDIVNPDRAFFGEKDYQQLQIIRKLTEITASPVEIIGCPILREQSGLARSSRNERLTSAQRNEAAFIYKTLKDVKNLFGTKSAKYISKWVEREFKNKKNLKLEYFEIANENSLEKLVVQSKNEKYRAFIAAYADDIRLIDNIAL